MQRIMHAAAAEIWVAENKLFGGVKREEGWGEICVKSARIAELQNCVQCADGGTECYRGVHHCDK